jgi:hypothetical protein
MPRLLRSPVLWYVLMFAAVVVWGATRHAPSRERATPHPTVEEASTPGAAVLNTRPELRRVAQHMVLR